MIEFLSPKFGLFLLILPLIYWIKKYQIKQNNAFIIPIISSKIAGKSKKNKIIILSVFLQYSILTLIILALTQPVITKQIENIEYEGIDIMLSIDVSNSMLSDDCKPNRLEAAKLTAINFVNRRIHDKIGLVAFAAESITLTPPTLTHKILINNIQKLRAKIFGDGTAIGLGISSALLRLKNSSSVSKVVILLTDGVNNYEEILPLEAAEAARDLGIKIYTIGINNSNINNSFDAELLKQISRITNANFFDVSNLSEFNDVYSQISTLEKTKSTISVSNGILSLQSHILSLALLFLFVEILLRITILKLL